MMKTGWWSVKFELTLEGEEIRWDDLDECTQEHIAECIKEGYTSGEIIIEDDEEDEEFCYGMTLRDFENTNVFYYADVVSIVCNGEEIDIPDEEWDDYMVVGFHKSESVGIIEVEVTRV